MRVAVFVTCLISSIVALADTSAAQAMIRQSTDIPAQPLDSALRTLAKQRGFHIVYLSGTVNAVRTQGATGTLTRDEALGELLKGTGLTFRYLDEGTVTVVPTSAPSTNSPAAPPAQDVAPPASSNQGIAPGGPPEQREAFQLEEIVVTARKREERLLDVPAPVSAITAETLQLTRATRLEDYLTRMPGVSFDEGRAGQTKVIFRGLNASDASATAITYLDNTPLTPPVPHANSGFLTPSLDPSELLQIEADRGPQGTLYGANAIGGVLKYVTVKPDPNNFSARAEVSGDAARGGGLGGALRGAVNIPLVSDRLGLRLSAFTRKDPGYVDDPLLDLKHLNSTRTYGFRAALLWNLSDAISVNLASLVQLMRNHGTDAVDIDPNTRQPLYGDWTHQRSLRDEFLVDRNAVHSADIQWDLQWAKLLSSTSFSTQTDGVNRDFSAAYVPVIDGALGFPVPNLGIDSPVQLYSRQVTEELRLTSATQGPVEWQVGAYYVHALTHQTQGARPFDTTTQDLITAFGSLFDGYVNDNYIERSGFGNIDYHFTPRFDVSVGARYSVDDQKSYSFFEGALFGPPTVNSGLAHEHAFTWSVNPRFKPSDLQTLYARVATGYRPGGAGLLTPQGVAAGLPAVFKPDHLTNYEVGWKASLPDQSATVDLSVYYIRWKDIQESIQLGNFGYFNNGGSAFSEGVEAAFTWTPVRRLNLAASVTYNDNRLEEDGQSPELSQSGKRLPFTPRFSGQFNADYSFPLMTGTDGFAGLTVFATAARPNAFSLGFDPTSPTLQGPVDNFGMIPLYDPNTGAVSGHTLNALPGYATLDLRAGVVHGPWTIEAYVKNVTDTQAWGEYGGNNNATYGNLSSQWAAELLPPRIAGISISTKF